MYNDALSQMSMTFKGVYFCLKISRNYLKIFLLLFAFSLVFGVISNSLVSYAKVFDLMIGTGSNALMTMDLDDSDYSIMPMSSIGTVVNTISSGSSFWVSVLATNGTSTYYVIPKYEFKDGRFYFKVGEPLDGYYFKRLNFNLSKGSLPAPGGYKVSLDYGSNFSHEYGWASLWSVKTIPNASDVSADLTLSFTQSSGDIYVAPFELNLTGARQLSFIFGIRGTSTRNIDGSVAINFTSASVSSSAPSTAGTVTTTEDYQSDVSSSLSDLSSSVDSMTEDLSSAAESLEYISTSQNLIIQGIDNVIMHISDQLYAFWDQLYNLIHEPTMAKMDEIIEAINNMDLEIEVNLDGLKQSIDNMSTAVQNKLQSVQDGINNKLQSVQETLTNGFNNSGINEDAAELDQSLQEYDEAEQNVLEHVNDSLNDFEFDGGFEEYANTIKVFSDFLQALYESSGGFKVVINLSLMLSIAGIVIGVYRFKQGG